jgi:hypothetical protein
VAGAADVAAAAAVVAAAAAVVAAEPLLLSPPHAAATIPNDTSSVVGAIHPYFFTQSPRMLVENFTPTPGSAAPSKRRLTRRPASMLGPKRATTSS